MSANTDVLNSISALRTDNSSDHSQILQSVCFIISF